MTAERPPGGSEQKAHRCAGLRRDGTPCAATVVGEQTYCWHHDPANKQARKTIASNAARSKTKPPRIVQIQGDIQDTIEQVKRGKLPTNKAAVMLTGYGVLIRACEQERRQRELDELEKRLAELEEIAEEER